MIYMDVTEILIGITEIAIALAGFTGVVVAFGSRREGSWHPGDRLRLGFLLEASLTAAAFALLGLLLFSTELRDETVWLVCSLLWPLYMAVSLITSRKALKENQDTHGDVDRFANKVTVGVFLLAVVLQVINVLHLQQFWPYLFALITNLAGAAMQFTRLIRSAFHI